MAQQRIRVLGRRNSVNVQKVMWTLGELRLAYEREDVAGSFGFPDGYAALNPNGVVPTICDGALTLYESNACVRYLARSYGAGTLWPDDPATLARADQWMEWQRSDVSIAFFAVFLAKVRLPAEQAKPAQLDKGVSGIARWYQLLDAHLAGNAYVAGNEFTMGDIPIGAMSHRVLTMEIERPPLPNVQRWYASLCKRPAYQKHVMIPFGRNHPEWLAEEARGAGIQ